MIHNRSLLKSFGYALEGVWHALRYNRNMKIHFAAALAVVILAVIFQIRTYQMTILGVMIILVISSEMINTAIEEMVDLITQDHKKEAKIAKDVAAGMVLVTAIGAVIIGFFIFTPYILKLFY